MTKQEKNKPELIRYLANEGWAQKNICLITKSKQSYVSRICNDKLRQNAEALPNFSEQEIMRYNALNCILSAPSLPTQGITKDDMCYIQLLKYCLVDKEVIRHLYDYISENRFRMLYTKKDIDFHDFDSTLIGIDLELFDDIFRI